MKKSLSIFAILGLFAALIGLTFSENSFARQDEKNTLTIVGNLSVKYLGDGDDDYEFVGKVESYDNDCEASIKAQARGRDMYITGTATIWDPMSDLARKVKECRNKHKIILDVKKSIYCGGSLVAKIKKFTCLDN